MQFSKTTIALSVAFTAALLQGCNSDTTLRQPKPLTVSVFEVAAPTETHYRNFKGQVMPAKSTDLSFRINGEIDRILVKPGEMVSKGELLAALDSDKLRQQLTDAEVSYELAVKQLKRAKELLPKKMISQSEYDSLAASQRIALMGYKQAQRNLEYARLTAPYNGIISEVPKESFESTVAGETVLSMHRNDVVELKINTSDSILAQINPYQNNYEAVVTFSGGTKEYAMKYYKHTTEPVPETQNYELWFRMAQPHPPILPGTSADIKMDMGTSTLSSFEIPFTALDTGRAADEFYVWKYSDGKVTPVTVEASSIASAGAVITSGLKEGDLLVNSGLQRLRANTSVIRATEE